MGKIRDIRLFESDHPNEDYFSIPQYIGRIYEYDSMKPLEVIQRLLFLLRSREFCFANFDHLYINYTPLLVHGQLQRSKRSVCREDNWLRWVDIGCDVELFNSLEADGKRAFILSTLTDAVLFMAEESNRDLVAQSIREVLEQGEQLVIPFKHKENDCYNVDVSVRITDDLDYIPVITVQTKDGQTVIRQILRNYVRDAFICQFSSFTIGKSSLRIIPRKNFESEFYELKPIKLTW